MLPQVQGGAERVPTGSGSPGADSPSTRASRSPRSIADGRPRDVYPSMRWIRQGSAWFVNARAGVAAWQYDLNQPHARRSRRARRRRGADRERRRRARLRARLDRSSARDFVQTLEPRALYTYIPFRNQNQLPVFDTVLDDFNFTQLFSENRFIGGDRVGDTNQLALAVTSRLLDPATGAERLRFAVGQRFYFEDQQVTCPGTTPQKAGSSDFLVGAEGRLSDAWSLIGLVQYNFGTSQLERFNVGTRYNPAPGKVLSLIYRYSRELVDQVGGQSELKQTYLSAQWPLSDNWTLLGAWNYSLPRPQDAGGGGRAGVQWRVLGAARCRSAADHDDGDANELDLRAARAQRTGARGNEPPRAPAAHRPRVPAHQRSGDHAARPQLRSPCLNSDGVDDDDGPAPSRLFLGCTRWPARRCPRSRSRFGPGHPGPRRERAAPGPRPLGPVPGTAPASDAAPVEPDGAARSRDRGRQRRGAHAIRPRRAEARRARSRCARTTCARRRRTSSSRSCSSGSSSSARCCSSPRTTACASTTRRSSARSCASRRRTSSRRTSSAGRSSARRCPYAKYREDIRREVTIQRLREREVDSRVHVSDAEVDNYLATVAAQAGGENEYLLAHIMVGVPEQATPDQIEQRADARARKRWPRSRAARSSAKSRRQYSDAPDAISGGDLGWRTPARLPSRVRDARSRT